MKAYLGDAVYAEHDGYNVVLTTSNGSHELARIYLEPEVAREVVRFIQAVEAERIPQPRPDLLPCPRCGASAPHGHAEGSQT